MFIEDKEKIKRLFDNVLNNKLKLLENLNPTTNKTGYELMEVFSHE